MKPVRLSPLQQAWASASSSCPAAIPPALPAEPRFPSTPKSWAAHPPVRPGSRFVFRQNDPPAASPRGGRGWLHRREKIRGILPRDPPAIPRDRTSRQSGSFRKARALANSSAISQEQNPSRQSRRHRAPICFLNASSTREIVFVRGTTEGINLVAQAWGRRNVQKDDEIVITWLEHHANIVPWQQLAAEKGARLRVAPVNDRGEVILEEY